MGWGWGEVGVGCRGCCCTAAACCFVLANTAIATTALSVRKCYLRSPTLAPTQATGREVQLRIKYSGRPTMASTATGFGEVHAQEQVGRRLQMRYQHYLSPWCIRASQHQPCARCWALRAAAGGRAVNGHISNTCTSAACPASKPLPTLCCFACQTTAAGRPDCQGSGRQLLNRPASPLICTPNRWLHGMHPHCAAKPAQSLVTATACSTAAAAAPAHSLTAVGASTAGHPGGGHQILPLNDDAAMIPANSRLFSACPPLCICSLSPCSPRFALAPRPAAACSSSARFCFQCLSASQRFQVLL